MDRLYNWLILSSIKGVGEKSLKVLYDRFGSAEEILSLSESELLPIVGKTKARAIHSREGIDERTIEKVIKVVEREGIKVTTLEEDTYPSKLHEIPDPPPILFYRGNISIPYSAGVVGARKPNAYTLRWVEDLVSGLSNKGIGVVSGGAQGVDRCAHEKAISMGLHTTCVLGFGILQAKGSLFDAILRSGGLILSEFLPNRGGDKFTFPKRNRIIAALSEFLVVPEASSKSGSLITARYAMEYGKKVYVHIGIGKSSSWDGCYKLLEEGAKLVKDHSHILGVPQASSGLEEFLRTPRTLEEIADYMNVSPQEAMVRLTDLELEGKVKRMGSFFCA